MIAHNILLMFKTGKCSHGDKGMCINCLINKQKHITKENIVQQKTTVLECKHQPHMKCLRCLPKDQHPKVSCLHPDYEKCKNCEWLVKYEKFSYHLESLNMQCGHKRPCGKCVPPLSRKNYFIDKSCTKHIPYPQAQCDGCMAPTLTVGPQKYAHVSKVIIKTTKIYRVAETKMFGILLGRIDGDQVIVEDVYFPSQQEPGSYYIDPSQLDSYSHIWEYLNLQEVGLLYHSNQITGLGLMISSLFQEKYCTMEAGHQISKFITMRLQLSNQGTDPHFESFMVSDQLQAFHKNSILYEKNSHENYFDLITAKNQKLSQLPTFLRDGLETDRLFFKQVLVWIETASRQNFFLQNSQIPYPFFTLQAQQLDDFRRHVMLKVDPLQKYQNIQFLLHLDKLIGRQSMVWFISNYLAFDPDLFIQQKLSILQKIEQQKLNLMQNEKMYNEN